MGHKTNHQISFVLGLLLLALTSYSQTLAQGTDRDARAKVVAAFNIQCADSAFPRKQLSVAIQKAFSEIWNEASHPETDMKHAVGYDLNGDGRKEYFVMLKDTGIGDNVFWGIFALKPARYLGLVFAEHVYLRRRVADWTALTISEHLNVSDSHITTYAYRGGKYIKVAGGYETSANRGDEPKFAGTTPFLCKRDSLDD